MSDSAKKVFIFDLDDTLAKSKQPVDKEMSDLLERLITNGKIVAVTSGGSFEQFDKQFLTSLHFLPAHFENLYLMPTSGATLYRNTLGKWNPIYSYEIPTTEKNIIINLIEQKVKKLGFWESKGYGNIIEDRGTQITFSGLGQAAPLKLKEMWDIDQSKRKQIVENLKLELNGYDINIGGKTSIDITKKGINKALGINELSKLLNIPIDEMVFVGDALYLGGNDSAAKETGIECISVNGVDDTKKYIKDVLKVT
jgi:phosphomannomutase